MIIKDSAYRIEKQYFTAELKEKLLIPNSDYGKRKKEPEYFEGFIETPSSILIPRNFDISNYLPYPIIDNTVQGKFVDFPEHNKTLFSHQANVSHKVSMDDSDQIILSPCASGKTIMGINIISRLKRKAVVLVPSELLLFQWIEDIQEELGFTPGIYYSEKKDIQDLTICLIHSLFRKDYGDVPEFNDVGLVVIDEVHQMGAFSLSKAVLPFAAKSRIGFTATLREDELDSLMFWHIGKVKHRIKRESLIEQGILNVPDVMVLEYKGKDVICVSRKAYCEDCNIEFYSKSDECINCHGEAVSREYDYVKTCTAVAHSERRNSLIVDAIYKCMSNNRKPLIICNRIAHIDILADAFTKLGYSVLKVYKNYKNYAEIPNVDIVIAIYEKAKQGLDSPSLDTVLIAFPMSKRGMVEQCIGRICRIGGKRPLILDIRDTATDMLNKMHIIRRGVYKRLGCTFKNGSPEKKNKQKINQA